MKVTIIIMKSNPLYNLLQTFVSSIDNLLSELAVSEDCYSLGSTSKILATELANFPPAKIRKKVCGPFFRISILYIYIYIQRRKNQSTINLTGCWIATV